MNDRQRRQALCAWAAELLTRGRNNDVHLVLTALRRTGAAT